MDSSKMIATSTLLPSYWEVVISSLTIAPSATSTLNIPHSMAHKLQASLNIFTVRTSCIAISSPRILWSLTMATLNSSITVLPRLSLREHTLSAELQSTSRLRSYKFIETWNPWTTDNPNRTHKRWTSGLLDAWHGNLQRVVLLTITWTQI